MSEVTPAQEALAAAVIAPVPTPLPDPLPAGAPANRSRRQESSFRSRKATELLTARLPAHLVDRVRRNAEAGGVSISRYLESLISAQLDDAPLRSQLAQATAAIEKAQAESRARETEINAKLDALIAVLKGSDEEPT